ncbi:MAG: DUF262 domain-containing protein [Planctomycetes bacterium]|nr:DUF262 domain-containing protein [Planctomycetota bacterium]
MRTYDINKTQYTVSDFLSWQRQGKLDLNPPFQRRSVWKKDAKSYFIDTILRELPVPIIFIRENIDLETDEVTREVVDGQQRLRAIFTYVKPSILRDFDATKDAFSIRKEHSPKFAGVDYKDLPPKVRHRILEYKFSTHVLPGSIGQREILEIFSRMNATGVKLNPQELRNAEWFGAFKSLMYELALEQLERWQEWGIFTPDQMARMKEVEFVSDLVYVMVHGMSGKTQKKLDDIYEEYDGKFASGNIVASRLRTIMDVIEEQIGDEIAETIFRSEVLFFTLFVYLYDRMWGLDKPLKKGTYKRPGRSLRTKLLTVSENVEAEEVDSEVLDAFRRAATDLGRRKTRHTFMKKNCG